MRKVQYFGNAQIIKSCDQDDTQSPSGISQLILGDRTRFHMNLVGAPLALGW